MIVIHILLILISFYLLAVVCERYFVDSLDAIAERWKMNSDMAGATLMAIGSSAPELFISLFALFKPGSESIGAGTIVGSALFNILVIIGATAIIRKAVIAWQPVIRDLIFYALSVILLILSFRDGVITPNEVIVFVSLYVVYLFAVFYWRKILPYKEESKEIIEELERGLGKEEKKKNLWGHLLAFVDNLLKKIFPPRKYYVPIFLMSIVMIMGLSWILVESAVAISIILKIPAVIIGLTVLAIGTSIPDFISSVVVAKQGRGGMAISNSIGSNIFNILIGLGLPWLVVTTFSNKTITVAAENLNSSIFLLFATIIVILFLLIFKKWRLGKVAGAILIGIYIIYLIWAILQVI